MKFNFLKAKFDNIQEIGKELLRICEREARSNGFSSMELAATLGGEQLYLANGYKELKRYEIELGNGITNKVVSMKKNLF